MEKPKKRRGRKAKKGKIFKKRGRKPKGGKIIQNGSFLEQENENIIPNIILHLKCSTRDLKTDISLSTINYTPEINRIESFDIVDKKEYDLYSYDAQTAKNIKKQHNTKKSFRKKISEKLKKLQKTLNTNDISNKKSNCFWCTYPFDNPSIYIPARKRIHNFEVYGCFCSPECAVGFLNKEKIDSSTRWERYSFLNNIYGKIFNYKKNIKPAPDPFHTLEKYYGNLTIEEYRKLLSNNFNLMIVNKPLTRILPELHEEDYEVQLNYMSIHNRIPDKNTVFSLKRKTTERIKKNIISKNFKNFSFS